MVDGSHTMPMPMPTPMPMPMLNTADKTRQMHIDQSIKMAQASDDLMPYAPPLSLRRVAANCLACSFSIRMPASVVSGGRSCGSIVSHEAQVEGLTFVTSLQERKKERSGTKRNERNETKRNETKRNERKENRSALGNNKMHNSWFEC